jgi:hypothetical protein
VHSPHVHHEALALHAAGHSLTDICRRLGLSRNTVASWLYGRRARQTTIDTERCPRCDRPPRPIDDPAAYAYLLGQYLGDGHLLMTRKVPLLTVSCDLNYLGVIHDVSTAMVQCGAGTVGFQEQRGCISVRSSWRHWPCLLPQHGPGPKHRRSLDLANWQNTIVERHADRFIRGLFHSDGSRFINRVRHGERIYEYPRYMFVNKSPDIMAMCRTGLDRLGIDWRMARPDNLSVARRDAVAALDRHVGPKW